MLFCGRKLTAQEACSRGLVSQVFWPTTFSQEVMLRVKEMASCSAVVSSRASAGCSCSMDPFHRRGSGTRREWPTCQGSRREYVRRPCVI